MSEKTRLWLWELSLKYWLRADFTKASPRKYLWRQAYTVIKSGKQAWEAGKLTSSIIPLKIA